MYTAVYTVATHIYTFMHTSCDIRGNDYTYYTNKKTVRQVFMLECGLVYLLLLLALTNTVHSSTQTYPRFEFRGNVLTNNSYILCGQVSSPTAIGEGVNNSLQCVTDYINCCNSGSGMGNWYDPRGMEVSD